MKIFISADMEGTAGLVEWRQEIPPDVAVKGGEIPAADEYAWGRRLLVAEVNAAVAGAFDAGATAVYVNESHDGMQNMLPEEVDPRAKLISGHFKQQSMMAGLDQSFDAVIFTGYHAKANSRGGVMAHTYTLAVSDAQINGVSVGEYGINAMVAGHYGVPVVCITGDQLACDQTRGLLGESVVGVAVKEGLSNYAAIHVHPQIARDMIRAGVRQGIAGRDGVAPYRPDLPITFAVEWINVHLADIVEIIPGIERVDDRVTSYVGADALHTFRMFHAMLNASASRFAV